MMRKLSPQIHKFPSFIKIDKTRQDKAPSPPPTPSPRGYGSYLAERIDAERRRLDELVRGDAFRLAPLEEVLALGDQDGPLGQGPAGVLARSGRHAYGLQGAVVVVVVVVFVLILVVLVLVVLVVAVVLVVLLVPDAILLAARCPSAGRRLLQGELGREGQLGRVEPAVSARDEVADVLVDPLEGDLEGQRAVRGCRS